MENKAENLKNQCEEAEKPEETNEVQMDAEKFEDQEFEELKECEEENLQQVLEEMKESNFKLNDENTKLENELEALKERLSRTVAEYDNYRKRTSKEKEGIYTDSVSDVLKEMLPVFDNLERAVAVEGSADDIKKGVEMTIKQFDSALSKLGVEEIPADGEFDPNLHNAVMHVEDETFGKNAVAEVFMKGYKRGEKVIRHSMVKVAN